MTMGLKIRTFYVMFSNCFQYSAENVSLNGSFVYKGNFWHANMSVAIERVQPAAPPIGGTFTISFDKEIAEGNLEWFDSFVCSCEKGCVVRYGEHVIICDFNM